MANAQIWSIIAVFLFLMGALLKSMRDVHRAMKVVYDVKADIHALSSKVDADVHKLSSKVDTDVHELSSKVNANVHELSSRVDVMTARFETVIEKIDALRREVVAGFNSQKELSAIQFDRLDDQSLHFSRAIETLERIVDTLKTRVPLP